MIKYRFNDIKGGLFEAKVNRIDNALPYINQLIERGADMDTRDEIARDEWIQENKFTCKTCRFNPTDDPVCTECEGQFWSEKDWAMERKKLIQANSKR